MPEKSYVTRMPDKSGAFLVASTIIAGHGGNIIRVSYNKAVDLHTLFVDVSAPAQALDQITHALAQVGYLDSGIPETRVLVISIRIPDVPGALLPVLKILSRFSVNISYMNASADGTPYQSFKMGLLIEEPGTVRRLLEEISVLYPVDIIDYEGSEEELDNTVTYIRLAYEMQKLLGLSTEKTLEFVSESNRILQTLQDAGENPDKVFDYIRRFAFFIAGHRGENFKADIETLPMSDAVLYSIQPPCGSNTYVLAAPGEVTLIDTGYTVYAREMSDILRSLFPDWESIKKTILVTHADVDHCGLLARIEDARILLNRKSAESLRRQSEGRPDNREHSALGFAYSRLSRLISGYEPPDPERFEVLDHDTPGEHENLLKIGAFTAAGFAFEVYEGSGGHLDGEMVFVCEEAGLLFTGDLLVNISGFSADRAEFNALAPYLMRSVNVNSRRATAMRRRITGMIGELEQKTGRSFTVCGGHGPFSHMQGGSLTAGPGKQSL